MSTVSLQMIIKDEYDAVAKLITNAQDWDAFDKINLTVSDKPTANKLEKLFKGDDEVTVVWREWTNNFADARNDNLKLCDTDFFFWVDADDEFEFETIPALVKLAEDGDYDAIYLPYNYARDDQGNTTTIHDRERLVRVAKGFTWRGAVHESLLCDDEFRGKKLSSPQVIHHANDVTKSMYRNHDILFKAVDGVKNPDPRMVYYLGISYFGLGEYENAINMLRNYIRIGGWNEEIYRAYLKIAECFYMMDQYIDAIDEAMRAAAILPSYPDAYFALARFEYGHDNWDECLEWIQTALSKPVPETMSVRNPMEYEYAKLHSAVCHYELRHYQTAYKHLKAAPEYLSGDLLPAFKNAANLEAFISMVPNLTDFIPEPTLFNALPDYIKYDNRLRDMRYRNIEPTKWPTNSIAYFCGKGYEPWGANTLDKGMGGSEEAVVYLSREMAKLGYRVTVFNECDAPYMDGESTDQAVRYEPWRKFDPRDEFDNLIVWRAPDYAKHLVKDGVKANRILVDVHDVLSEDYVTDIPGVTYMVKSNAHRKLFKHLPDDKFVIVGNGIKVSQFDNTIKKDPHTIGFFSAYYRGLDTLLEKIWPKVLEAIPDAKCHVAYGWNSWVSLEGENAFYHKVNDLFDKYKDSVIHHNRLSHVDLAKLMGETQVWAYPTQFFEIHCITALKAQQAGCYPVTTDVGALKETVQSGVKLETMTIATDEYQQKKFVNAIVDALENGKTGTPVPNVDWSDVAKVWDETLCNR